MKSSQVDEALFRKFNDEGHRLVFWHDADAEFTDYVAAGLPDGLANVEVLDVAAVGGLSAKLKLEREDNYGQYLVYSHGEKPAAEFDWLLDLRLYSELFQADVTSIWLQELGLSRLTLCDHLKIRTAFLKSSDRRGRLAKKVKDEDDENSLDLKMLSVLTGSALPTVFDVLMALCDHHVKDGVFELEEEPAALADIRKKGLEDSFWNSIEAEFYYREDRPSIGGLLRRLLATELVATTPANALMSLAQFRLPDDGQRQVAVFLTQWRDSASRGSGYDAVAEAVATDLQVDDKLGELEWETLLPVKTFWVAEKMVVSALSRRLLDNVRPELSEVQQTITLRCESHWLAGAGSDRPERAAVAAAYRAIDAAAQMFDSLDHVPDWLRADNASTLLTGYRDRWYQVDQHYRLFHTYAAPSNDQGWNLLKSLSEEVESRYDQRFIQPLGVAWSVLLDDEPIAGDDETKRGFLNSWQLPDFLPQQHFYRSVISPWLKESPRRRAFVIISDALRFEVANELAGQVKGQYRFDAQLKGMLGVVPSYTGLGMASLLPHEDLSYNVGGHVLVDGASTAGIEARGKLLQRVNGVACKAEDLIAMKKEAAKAFIEGSRVVYIYHNEIDAVGDTASTESDTFEAVQRAIDTISSLIRRCVNDLNGSRVWVTADHGFLFQVVSPQATDRSGLLEKPTDTLKSKKRYVIKKNLDKTANAHLGNTAVTAGTNESADYWIPRGANRFHFTGGARFVHGGAMPQEIVVPLLSISEVGGKRKSTTRVEPVGIQIMGANHKITTPVHRFTLLQTEPVSDRRLAVAVRVALYENDQPVSSVEQVLFDNTSDRADERQRTIKLQLSADKFDKQKAYYLRLHYLESKKEACSVPVVIDRSFDDDF